MDTTHEGRHARPLSSLGYGPGAARALAAIHHVPGIPARVLERRRAQCVLHTGDAARVARLLPGCGEPAVGDWVHAAPDPHGDWWLHAIAPRATELARLEPSGTRQVLVANVDLALLVMGLDGDWNPRRLDRYLALVLAAGVVPVVVATKADACEDAEARLAGLATRLPARVERHAVDARSARSTASLHALLGPGTTAVLLGSSGAGKSTLTNTLAGHDRQATGAVREGDDRGRHTTTARTLRSLPGGGCLIDTPGLRGLRLDVDVAGLDASFEDVTRLAAGCRFRDCGHGSEPGCAVRGRVDADRLANWAKLRREVASDRRSPVVQQAAKAKGKVLARAQRALCRQRER